MPNQLINETSLYLLQHAHNPVNWLPWSDKALEKAKQENKPIFLRIGYAACHWCHVMDHESFEDTQIAKIINSHFIPIRVDREERPDLDSIYMVAVVAMTRQGGWPMSVFLTPQAQPFYGGTYFPATARHGLPSFREVLISVAEAWAQNQSRELHSRPLADPVKLQDAAELLINSADPQNGGWGSAPKFPAPMILDFLLLQQMKGNVNAFQITKHTLEQMQMGGIFDVVGGGFHRYATDQAWLIPHFEKMLYDNAQLAATYLHAYLITGNLSFRRTCESTLNFLVREMRHPQGGFFSSIDADSEGQEGKFYLWTPEQIHTALSANPDLEDLILFTYPITESGNFESRSILRRELNLDEIAAHFRQSVSQIQNNLDEAHKRLRSFRSSRVRPATDDKILSFWNALALRAFAEAARYLHREDYLKIAEKNAEFILEHFHVENRLKNNTFHFDASPDKKV
ncbi:MAG: thioredoxin domain-containing protein [Anaerolineaceae bacterium]|nr:thioredoxin domain-containing protein [Anaerolineaceae bacterium]